MHIDLSRVSNTKGHPHISGYWNRKETSSASYCAKQLPEGRFVLYRFPKDGAEFILLGQAPDEATAEARIDWWVRNDYRVRATIAEAFRKEQPLNLLPLILESAAVK